MTPRAAPYPPASPARRPPDSSLGGPPHPELLPDRDDVTHRLVVAGSEHEAEADGVDALRDRLRLQLDIGPERLEHVGGPALARGRAVAVLGHLAASTRSYEGGRGGDV